MKKLLSILLAVLTVFSFCSVAVAAEDVSEPATEVEPVETFNSYEICEDPDFLVLQYMGKGNDKATLLQPGDKITTYKKNSDIDVLYYPDADAMYNGDWEPADPNNLAFSTSAAEYFKESFPKKVGEATIRGLDYTDFTIAYSDENVFLGWVVYSYEPGLNSIILCGVWEKNHKITTSEDTDDVTFIMDYFSSFVKLFHEQITLPFLQFLRTLSNAFLYVQQWLYDNLFGEKPAA